LISTDFAPRPVVLVVEDNARARELRVDAFNDGDCTAIGVPSHDDAVRELRASPAVDLVLTDIHLTRDPGDKSGVALARYVKTRYASMPVSGYSAVFDENELRDDEALFVDIWPKGRLRALEVDDMVSRCRERAMQHRQERRQEAFDALSLLQRKHELEHPDVELMRELRPDAGSEAPVDEALRKAGYRLRLIESTENGFARSIIVWLLEVDGLVEAEVYGQPAFYADGRTDEEAISHLVELMRLYAAEIGDDAPEAAGPALSLTEFLRRLTGEEEVD